MGFST